MTDEQEPVCATCGERTGDFDPLVGFDDFQDGACYHAACMTNALHEALGKAEAERDELRVLVLSSSIHAELIERRQERDEARALLTDIHRQVMEWVEASHARPPGGQHVGPRPLQSPSVAGFIQRDLRWQVAERIEAFLARTEGK